MSADQVFAEIVAVMAYCTAMVINDLWYRLVNKYNWRGWTIDY